LQSSNIKFLPQVDHLRAIAAIWIVLYHAQQLLGSVMLTGQWFGGEWPVASSPFSALIIEGHSAVALFMVLSGFIFAYGTYGKEISYSKFILNRILRIYPLYLVVIFFSISISPQNFVLAEFVSTVLPLANVGLMQTNGAVGMSWAVAVEFQFYLIFPFILLALNSAPAKTIVSIIAVALAFRLLAIGLGADPRDMSYSHLVGRIDQFVLGMGAALLLRALNGSRYLLLSMFFGGAGAVVYMLFWLNHHGGWVSQVWWKILWPTIEGAVYAVFIVGYVGSKNMFPVLLSNCLCKVGECSFSIYLLHFSIVLMFATRKDLVFHPTGNSKLDLIFMMFVVVLPVVLVFSMLTYRVIERPFLSFRKRYVSGHTA